jgi:hypothetical protein
MDERARQDALRLLRAAKNIFAEQHGNNDEWFWAGTPVDLVAAGERVGMPVGWPDHDAAVRWLESENTIEAAELTRNVVGGKFYLVTAHGVELVR